MIDDQHLNKAIICISPAQIYQATLVGVQRSGNYSKLLQVELASTTIMIYTKK